MFLYVVGLLGVLFNSHPLFAGEKLFDGLIAEVNSKPILYSDIAKKLGRGQVIKISEYPATESDPDFEKALQDAINFELVMQKVNDLELSVAEEDVESEIRNFLNARKLTFDGLKEALAQQGMTYEDYKSDFKDQMIISKFQGRVIAPMVKIKDKDLENFYFKKAGGSTAEKVSLSLRKIFISIPTGANAAVKEAKEKRAKEVHEKLQGGMDFLEAVSVYSDDSGAKENGGLMGDIKLEELDPKLKAKIKVLDIGQFSEPVETESGIFIFYLDKKSFMDKKDFERQKRQLEAELRPIEVMEQTKKWLADERRRAKIDIKQKKPEPKS